MKIRALILARPIQICNTVEKDYYDGQILEGRIRLRFDTKFDSRGIMVHWSTAEGLPMGNFITWSAIDSVVFEDGTEE